VRVTSEMMISQSLQRLSTRLLRYERAQSDVATGKRIRTPSDDPAGASRALTLRASQRAREQESRNADDALGWLGISASQLQSAVDRLQRARDLSVRAASTLSASERSAIAQELESIQTELVGLANSSYRGRPLFAGFAGGPAVSGGPGAWSYSGDTGEITRRVGEREGVRINVTAAEVFGLTPTDGGVFARLDEAAAGIRAGDTTAGTDAIAAMDEAIRLVSDSQARLGANTNWVESAQLRGQEVLQAIRVELSEVEDVDLAEAMMDLQTQQVAYEATLRALARALPPSLVTFLS